MTSTRLTGGEAIVQGLLAHGVDTVFGLPGAQVYGLFDAFKQAEHRVHPMGQQALDDRLSAGQLRAGHLSPFLPQKSPAQLPAR